MIERIAAISRLENRKKIKKRSEIIGEPINMDLINSTDIFLKEYYNLSLNKEDYQRIFCQLEKLSNEGVKEYKLSTDEWIVSGLAGVIGAIMDICLVKTPKNPGLLGSLTTEGGPLSNGISNFIKNNLSLEEIKKLEKNNWVPYDAPYSENFLEEEVEGLGTRSHRLHSLGHDPILGFIFGVKDILNGTFSGIDQHGNYILSEILKDNQNVGISFFQAFIKQLGHLKSDIATPAGLPVPFAGLLQFCQFGTIEGSKKTYDIGEISRLMYMKGYNLNHFVASAIPTLTIEFIIRLYYVYKQLKSGKEVSNIEDWIPFNKVKVDKMLLVSHTIALGGNIIKVTATKNPLSISLPQFIAFFYQISKELKRTFQHSEEKSRNDYVMKFLEIEGENVDIVIDKELSRLGISTD
ncbi:MAG: hypothetical protein ACRCUA_00565 [Fusobacteriaceae bacterium]